ncbi:hypothetical protein N1F78_06565 [Seonamhaeicola sp. MEBiC1930]
MEPNLPELPTFETASEESEYNESKLRETLQDNLQFMKSLLYLTKKIFML